MVVPSMSSLSLYISHASNLNNELSASAVAHLFLYIFCKFVEKKREFKV